MSDKKSPLEHGLANYEQEQATKKKVVISNEKLSILIPPQTRYVNLKKLAGKEQLQLTCYDSRYAVTGSDIFNIKYLNDVKHLLIRLFEEMR